MRQRPLWEFAAGFVYFTRPTEGSTLASDLLRIATDGSGEVQIVRPGRLMPLISVGSTAAFWSDLFSGEVYRCVLPACPNPDVVGTGAGAELVHWHEASSTLFWGTPPGNGGGDPPALWSISLASGSATPHEYTAHPVALASDDGAVYFANGSSGSAGAGIYRVAPPSTTVVPLLTRLAGAITTLASNRIRLFFAGNFDQGEGQTTDVYEVPLPNGVGAGKATLFGETRAQVQGMVADVSAVFWSTSDGVVRCPTSGCEAGPQVVFPGSVLRLAQDDSAVYFVNAGRVMKVAK